jgi:aspartate-semialdehyde dehydrogenase
VQAEMTLAVVGATGLVGQSILEVLEERASIPVGALRPLATEGQGRAVHFRGQTLAVQSLSETGLKGADVVFFAATNAVSAEWAPRVVEYGGIAIDKSSHFRLDESVPLVVPEVNGHVLRPGPKIVASPNCSTIQLVMVLAPLLQRRQLSRVLVSTYQAVSGSGREAMEQLTRELEATLGGGTSPARSVYPHPIAMNVIPQCDRVGDLGFTGEEWKLTRETAKILGQPMRLSATAVRVPVMVGHGESVYVEFDRPVAVAEVREWLREAHGVRVADDPAFGVYPTPLQAAGNDWVWVGRLRSDPFEPRGLHLFIVSDNLRKGAASNAVDILERLIQQEG